MGVQASKPQPKSHHNHNHNHNAPINVKPHYPPPGLTKGLVGDFRRFDQKFCPTSGAFDRSKFYSFALACEL